MIASGASTSSVIVHVPHASTSIPDEVRRGIVLDDHELAVELQAMTDAYTDRIARAAADLLDPRPWLVINPYSRLVVDPERFPDAGEELNRVGMGAVYTRTSTGRVLRTPTPQEHADLIARYFRPYAETVRDLVDDRLAVCDHAVIVDLHSYPSTALPYELHADLARPTLCIGRDEFHTDDALIDAAGQAWSGLGPSVINEPFSGAYVPLSHHRRDKRVEAIMLELRRDSYLDEDDHALTPELDAVVTALSRFLAAIANPSFPRRSRTGPVVPHRF